MNMKCVIANIVSAMFGRHSSRGSKFPVARRFSGKNEPHSDSLVLSAFCSGHLCISDKRKHCFRMTSNNLLTNNILGDNLNTISYC